MVKRQMIVLYALHLSRRTSELFLQSEPMADTPADNTDNMDWQSMTVDELTERIAESVDLLQAVIADRGLLQQVPDEVRIQLLTAAGKASKPELAELRTLWKANRRDKKRERKAIADADDALLASTGIRKQRLELVYPTPLPEHANGALPASSETEAPRELTQPQVCYVCKDSFTQVHFFYDLLCTDCAALNWRKRHQTADLTGRVAMITGARVKIGYQAAIMLLRAGARVIALTRFPRDAVVRYAREPDFEVWSDRLQVYGLDLAHTPSVETFAEHINATYDRLDFILNNACQTVRRPADFYAHLAAAEASPVETLPPPARAVVGNYEALREECRNAQLDAGVEPNGLATISQMPLPDDALQPANQLFPAGQLDADLQQIDLRKHNSWRLTLSEVSAVELLQVHLVNAVAPFILNARLKPLMLRHPSRDKHIVNVSAMEGQFYRALKTDKHPHTNMAKAALNMMTRTSASDYVKDGIHMNSVDTGWITDEDPVEIAERKIAEHRFHPPLDHVDAAARICDPIFSGLLTGEHVWGQFLKDYTPTHW
jgi:NAD(P)-dependent dehydrogenase (short-subunit alcohol dehydrogenase family)